jgi:hypothetical protein
MKSDSGSDTRFDDDAAHRILRRAAEEQARRDSEAVDSYTLEQLEEIASQAGISPEAVRAAALEVQASADRAAKELQVAADGGGGGWLAALRRRMPASWSPRAKNAVVLAVGVALFALVVSMVGVGPVVLTLSLTLMLILLLLLVGLGPV